MREEGRGGGREGGREGGGEGGWRGGGRDGGGEGEMEGGNEEGGEGGRGREGRQNWRRESRAVVCKVALECDSRITIHMYVHMHIVHVGAWITVDSDINYSILPNYRFWGWTVIYK